MKTSTKWQKELVNKKPMVITNQSPSTGGQPLPAVSKETGSLVTANLGVKNSAMTTL